jgi:hypothetical protein
MPNSIRPHLIDRDGEKLCSICKLPFLEGTLPSISKAFAEHIRAAHKRIHKKDDVGQTAARIVKK